MKLRKYLALFLAAALMVSVLPQRGSAASVSEMMEDAETENMEFLNDTVAKESGDELKPESETEQESDNYEAEQDSIVEIEEDSDEDKSKTDELTEEMDLAEAKKNSEETEAKEDESTELTEKMEEKSKTSELAEKEQVLCASDDIASGKVNDITWAIDANGKLILNGTGNLGWIPWEQYREFVISAEVNVANMTDANNLFYDCKNLINVDMRNFDTSSVRNMRGMFWNCQSLRDLDLSGLNTENVIDMSNMFTGCKNLSSLNLNNFSTVSSTDMQSMFEGCSSMVDLNLRNFDTRNVINMQGMFSGCNSLVNLDLSNFNTSNVVNMSGMFQGCKSLINCNLYSFDTRNVTDMGGMFAFCSDLNSLDLSNFDTTHVTNMGGIFSTLTRTSGGMFYGCSNLSSLNLSSFNTTNVINMAGMFSECSNLTKLDLSGFNTVNVNDMGGMFCGCSSLKSLDLSSFDTANVTSMYCMFKDCSDLDNLELKTFDTMKTTEMSGMFEHCSSLTELDLNSFNTANVTRMVGMFRNCNNLTIINMSNFSTDNVTAIAYMFYGCSALKTLDLSNFNFANVTYGGGTLHGCSGLVTIYTPYNIRAFDSLPSGPDIIWLLPNGTEITELPQNLDHSVMITRRRNPKIITTTPDLNMDDVIRVKYVPYSYTVETDNWDENNEVTFSIEKGELAEGLQLYPETGEIYGVPLETGEFPITVKASYSNPEYFPSYADLTLTVIDNTDSNVLNASDAGYEVEQHIGSQMYDSADTFSYVVTESADQLFISAGAYSEFMDFWLNGRKLVEGEDYTKESGSTRITIRKQTFEEKADQNGTNTIAAEFRVDGNPNNALKRTAQNFRMDIQGGSSNNEHGSGSGSGSRDRGEDSGGSSSGIVTGSSSFATSVIRLVDASGNPLPDTILELHSTPQEARTDQNGIAVFAEVENGVHTLYAKNGNGTIFALKSFELLFGENIGIMNDQITVKAGTAFTLNVQVDGNELKFLNLQEGDLYQVVSAATSDDTRPAIWFLLAVLSAGTISGGILYRRRKQYAGSMQ